MPILASLDHRVHTKGGEIEFETISVNEHRGWRITIYPIYACSFKRIIFLPDARKRRYLVWQIVYPRYEKRACQNMTEQNGMFRERILMFKLNTIKTMVAERGNRCK